MAKSRDFNEVQQIITTLLWQQYTAVLLISENTGEQAAVLLIFENTVNKLQILILMTKA